MVTFDGFEDWMNKVYTYLVTHASDRMRRSGRNTWNKMRNNGFP